MRVLITLLVFSIFTGRTYASCLLDDCCNLELRVVLATQRPGDLSKAEVSACTAGKEYIDCLSNCTSSEPAKRVIDAWKPVYDKYCGTPEGEEIYHGLFMSGQRILDARDAQLSKWLCELVHVQYISQMSNAEEDPKRMYTALFNAWFYELMEPEDIDMESWCLDLLSSDSVTASSQHASPEPESPSEQTHVRIVVLVGLAILIINVILVATSHDASREMDFPDEIQVDIFCHLDRLTLEVLKLTSRRFERIIDAKMGSVCVRALVNVVLVLKKYKEYVVEAVLNEVVDESGCLVPNYKRLVLTGSSCPPTPVKHVESTFESLDDAVLFLVHTVRSSVIRNNLFLRHLSLSPAFIAQLAQLRKVTWLEGCLQLQYVDSTAISPLALLESFAHVGGLSCRDSKFDNPDSLDDSFLKRCSEMGVSTVLLRETASSISEEAIVDWISGRNDDQQLAYLQCPDDAPRARALKLWAPHTTDDLFLNLVMAAHACEFDGPLVLILCRLDRDLQAQIDWAFNGNPLNAVSVEYEEWNGNYYPFYIFAFRDAADRTFEVRWCSAEGSLLLIRDAERFARWGFPIEDRCIQLQ